MRGVFCAQASVQRGPPVAHRVVQAGFPFRPKFLNFRAAGAGIQFALESGMEEWAPLGFRGAVEEFKRRLIETALRQSGGNRTRAARCLGLQRTYLLRLIRDLGVSAPPPASAPGGFTVPRSRPEPGPLEPPPSVPVVPRNGAHPPHPGEKR